VESEWAMNPYLYGLTYAGFLEPYWTARPRLAALIPGDPLKLLTNCPAISPPTNAVYWIVGDGQQIESGPFGMPKVDPGVNFPYGFDVS